jgi:hypothetical protein
MLRRVAVVRVDVSEECSASIIRVTRIGELGTTLAVTSNRSVLTRTIRRNIPEYDILYSHSCENLKSYLIVYFISFIMFPMHNLVVIVDLQAVTFNKVKTLNYIISLYITRRKLLSNLEGVL